MGGYSGGYHYILFTVSNHGVGKAYEGVAAHEGYHDYYGVYSAGSFFRNAHNCLDCAECAEPCSDRGNRGFAARAAACAGGIGQKKFYYKYHYV